METGLALRPPTGALKAQTIPFNKVMQTMDAHFEKMNDSTYTFTLPETVSGWCELSVKGERGDSVKLCFISDEGLDYGQKDVYVLKVEIEKNGNPNLPGMHLKRLRL